MPTEGKFVTLGPFEGGLNTYSNEAAVADNELVECTNFELDIDGALKCRPPIKAWDVGVTTADRMYICGNGVINNVPYVFGSNGTGLFRYTGGAWTQIVANLFCIRSVQFRDKVYFPAHAISGALGGCWDGTTWTSLPNMPRGEAITIYKNRLWIAPGTSTVNKSRLHFSDIDPNIWNAADFFDVHPGDGEYLMDLVVFNNNLLLFKQDSTYALSYDSKVADSVITKISNTIGATANWCVAQQENELYVYHEGEVFQMINYEWVKTSLKVPFVYDATTPPGKSRVEVVKLCFVGQRLILRFYNKVYVFNIKTRTWSEWKSAHPVLNNFSHFVQYPSNDLNNVLTEYIGGSSLLQDKEAFTIRNGWNSVETENYKGTPVEITCRVRTKNYSMNAPFKFKRLFWWGVEASTSKPVRGIATPVVIGSAVTWGTLQSSRWQDLGTWDFPGASASVVTDIPNTEVGDLWRFFKFLKGLRFRQINFAVELKSNGSTNDGPAELYTIIPVIDPKQTASRSAT